MSSQIDFFKGVIYSLGIKVTDEVFIMRDDTFDICHERWRAEFASTRLIKSAGQDLSNSVVINVKSPQEDSIFGGYAQRHSPKHVLQVVYRSSTEGINVGEADVLMNPRWGVGLLFEIHDPNPETWLSSNCVACLEPVCCPARYSSNQLQQLVAGSLNQYFGYLANIGVVMGPSMKFGFASNGALKVWEHPVPGGSRYCNSQGLTSSIDMPAMSTPCGNPVCSFNGLVQKQEQWHTPNGFAYGSTHAAFVTACKFVETVGTMPAEELVMRMKSSDGQAHNWRVMAEVIGQVLVAKYQFDPDCVGLVQEAAVNELLEDARQYADVEWLAECFSAVTTYLQELLEIPGLYRFSKQGPALTSEAPIQAQAVEVERVENGHDEPSAKITELGNQLGRLGVKSSDYQDMKAIMQAGLAGVDQMITLADTIQSMTLTLRAIESMRPSWCQAKMLCSSPGPYYVRPSVVQVVGSSVTELSAEDAASAVLSKLINLKEGTQRFAGQSVVRLAVMNSVRLVMGSWSSLAVAFDSCKDDNQLKGLLCLLKVANCHQSSNWQGLQLKLVGNRYSDRGFELVGSKMMDFTAEVNDNSCDINVEEAISWCYGGQATMSAPDTVVEDVVSGSDGLYREVRHSRRAENAKLKVASLKRPIPKTAALVAGQQRRWGNDDDDG